ncbi:alpha/beta hydrolase [Cellvibrio sp. NN19]|uniref:alpha/beta hydrolase n=1 Tax=Cellvibrio chitinivorans TaxID=3102792 RepID=UPI002B41347D|nr:alpha/beta hydrolase [Cellvibrio sp. NN19]
MVIVRRFLRIPFSIFLLFSFCSIAFASEAESLGIGASVKKADMTAAQPVSSSLLYSQEISLWPESSKVLQAGIEIISNDEYALSHPWLVITHPTMIRYTPQKKSTGTAVIVFPGGGYKGVAIGRESTIGFNGADVCQWLTSAGINCFILKYRVPNSGCSWNSKLRQHETPNIPMALQDAQRAIAILRYHAKKYDLDPNKIGVMGFSSGGNLAVLASALFKKRAYEPIDKADQVSSRPDFAIPVYPGHLTMEHKNKKPRAMAKKELNSDIEISSAIPPTLLIHALDDPIDPVHYSKVYDRELRRAGVNVKLMLYETGGHGFGVKKQGKDTDKWTADALDWLKEINML